MHDLDEIKKQNQQQTNIDVYRRALRSVYDTLIASMSAEEEAVSLRLQHSACETISEALEG